MDDVGGGGGGHGCGVVLVVAALVFRSRFESVKVFLLSKKVLVDRKKKT